MKYRFSSITQPYRTYTYIRRNRASYVSYLPSFLPFSLHLPSSSILSIDYQPYFQRHKHHASFSTVPSSPTRPLSVPAVHYTCGSLRESDVGKTVRVRGWIAALRPLSSTLFFLLLRDPYGVVQIMVDTTVSTVSPSVSVPSSSPVPWSYPSAVPVSVDCPSFSSLVKTLKLESIIEIIGTVHVRPLTLQNKQMITGKIEIHLQSLLIYSTPHEALPLVPGTGKQQINQTVSDDIKLMYRYLELRKDYLQRNIRLRSLLTFSIRQYLLTQVVPSFVEIDTPTLFRSTPEGAREFLVPSRQLPPGKMYALVQSPQQYKQLLMVGGMDRYFQIARCYRDEAGRADRQPEFTQIDVEMSFVYGNEGQKQIMSIAEGIIHTVLKTNYQAYQQSKQTKKLVSSSEVSIPLYNFEAFDDTYPLIPYTTVSLPLPRITFTYALMVYGSDKPDRRIGMPIYDLTHIYYQSMVVNNNNVNLSSSLSPPSDLVPIIHQYLVNNAEKYQQRYQKFTTQGYLPITTDNDLYEVSAQHYCFRGFKAPTGFGSKLSRKQLELLVTEISQLIKPKVTGIVENVKYISAYIDIGIVQNDGISLKGTSKRMNKEYSKELHQRIIHSMEAKPGDLVVVGVGQGKATALALGMCRLMIGELGKQYNLPLVPHNTTIGIFKDDIILQNASLPMELLKITSTTNTVPTQLSGSAVKNSKSVSNETSNRSLTENDDLSNPIVSRALDLFWVTDFPLFEDTDEMDDENKTIPSSSSSSSSSLSSPHSSKFLRLQSVHHPFTAPIESDNDKLTELAQTPLTHEKVPLLRTIRGAHYDLVCNGTEIGGGSLRIYNARIQENIFTNILSLPPNIVQSFHTLLSGLKYGAPPHGGFAIGLDRLIMIIAGSSAASSIRDVIAFPKSAMGNDLLTGAPAHVSLEQLQEYHIQVIPEKKDITKDEK